MASVENSTRYTAVAIALHWLVFLLIVAGWWLGHYMGDLPFSPSKLKLISYHKWIGVVAFLFIVVRLIWLAAHKPPALPAAMPAWQKQASTAIHVLLYALIIAIPLSGWLHSSAAGVQTVLFGQIPIPDLLSKDKALSKQLEEIHEVLNNVLAFVVLLHVAAALKHHYVDKDDVLKRMLPKFK